ncbi:hypothetical protein JOD20_001321 [Herpetosiphon giganteus]|nr:hypothetical protein [Herpetosiphon giganteus]
MLGDENPRRFPPAEGRKGGETNVKQSAMSKNETAKIFRHELHEAREGYVFLPQIGTDYCDYCSYLL